jgi:cadmium resistance protein CadD (predicted permease)
MSAAISFQVLFELLSVASVSAVSYVSTNFDNLIILSAYSIKPGFRRLYVSAAFISVCLTVLFVSLALALAAEALPKDKVRYMGLIPMAIGAYHLLQLFRTQIGSESPRFDEPVDQIGVAAYLAFASVLLANSTDTIGAMTPLFADLKPIFIVACFTAAIAGAVAMSSLANTLARHPASRYHLEKWAKWILPFLMIGIGALILTDEPLDIFVTTGSESM